MTSLVTVEERLGYAVVGLNRPEKKNALNRAARRELLAGLTFLRAECRAIVLTGFGDSFCSGVDLKEALANAEAGTPPDPGSDWIEVLIAIREHPAVFIAAVNGLALGGGRRSSASATWLLPPMKRKSECWKLALEPTRNSRGREPRSSSRPDARLGWY